MYITHYIKLKSEYNEVKKLRALSGFGWDSERQIVTAPVDVWNEYVKV